MNHGLAYDHISNFKGLGLVHLLIDGKFHMMKCEKVNITYLEKDEKCFSEGVLRARRKDNNQTILVTRAGFITKFANEVSCDRDKKTEERARTKMGQRQTILLSSEILALYIFHNIASPLVFSRLFGLKTVTELLLKQGEWITGYSRRSVITILHVFWKSLSPWLIFAYTTIKIGWGFVIFTIGLKFKIGAQTLTFLLTPIKQAMELRKLLIERNLASSQMISRDYLNRTGQRLGIANITHAHLSSLYENACMANARIEILERRLDGGSSCNGCTDCVITFSSDDSNENTGNNAELPNGRAEQENTGNNNETERGRERAAPENTVSQAGLERENRRAAPENTGSQAGPERENRGAAPENTGSQAGPERENRRAAHENTGSHARLEIMNRRAAGGNTGNNGGIEIINIRATNEESLV